MSGARKHLTKKARKLLQMAEKEQSNINKQHSKSSSVRKSSFNLSKEETVCQASLMCLNEILKNCSNFIKHTIMKVNKHQKASVKNINNKKNFILYRQYIQHYYKILLCCMRFP